MYLVYILKSDNLSYVGMTNDFFRRWRQHNQEIKGGAKYTKKKNYWYPICIIDGFPDKKSACQCEWRLKHSKPYKGPLGRIQFLSKYISKNLQWTKKSSEINQQNLTIYIDPDFKEFFNENNHNFFCKELYWK